jgi:hypothetical protein
VNGFDVFGELIGPADDLAQKGKGAVKENSKIPNFMEYS